tara:strand:- start:2143 stop:2409 length:267 start_codon:yes stop_codon:yes gene_type:complete
MNSRRTSKPRTPIRSTHRNRRRATSRRSTRKESSSPSKSSLLRRIGSLERNQETMRKIMNRLNDNMKKLLSEKEKGRPPSGMYMGGGK